MSVKIARGGLGKVFWLDGRVQFFDDTLEHRKRASLKTLTVFY